MATFFRHSEEAKTTKLSSIKSGFCSGLRRYARNDIFVILFSCLLFTTPAFAAANIEHDKVRLQSLNKTTAQTSTFEMEIGETIKLGPLYVRPQACRTTPVTEEPESAAFIQIWTVNEPQKTSQIAGKTDRQTSVKSEWIFSGWMFASSPGLSSMDHAVYDLWVLDCGKDTEAASIVAATTEEKEGEDIEVMDEEKIIEESTEDAPRVILDGKDISVRDTPDDLDPKFEDYENLDQDVDESAPIVHLE